MIWITVLYTDLTSQKTPIDKISDLPKDGVLFIKLSTDTREGKFANISHVMKFDNYAVLSKKTGGDYWYMLFGWNDDDYIWRRECTECVNREVVDAPIGTMHVIFRGASVSDKIWKQAMLKVDKEL